MATIKSEYYRFNGITWDVHYFKTTMDMVDGLTSALDGKIDKRSGILKSGGIVDTTGLFPYAITTASTAIGFEYNVLLNASKKGYTFTQSGTGQIANPAELCDGKLEPRYSPDGINPADPFILLIEGLPNVHTQTGAVFGWTSRYWNPTKYKVEAYDQYAGGVWKTLVDEQTGVTTKDLVIPIFPTFSGALTKFRITIYDSNGAVGTNGFRRWGLSEIFFIHPEAQSTHSYLDVEWAKKLSTARTINGVSFDGSANITVPSSDVPSWAKAQSLFYNEQTIDGNLSGTVYLSKNWIGSVSVHTSAPNNVNGWYLLQNIRHRGGASDGTSYGVQIATGMTVQVGRTFTRTHSGGVWTDWIELYHTGNFNPSNYLPLTQPVGGSIINGAITFNDIVSFNQSIVLNTLYVDTITNDGGSLVFSALDSLNFNGAVLMNVSDPFNAGDAINKGYLDARITLPDSNTVKLQKNFVVLQSYSDVLTLGDESLPSLICGPSGQGAFEIYGGLSATLDIYSRGKKVATLGSVVQKTGSYTFSLADADNFTYFNSSSSLLAYIPTNTSVAFPIGTELHIMRYGTGDVTITPASGVTLVSDGNKRKIAAQYAAVTVKKILTDTWAIIGALKA